MATIVSTLFTALDGVVEIDPAWHFPYFDEHMGAAVSEDYEGVDALVLGRVTYDSFAGAWPEREAAGGEDATFAKRLGDTRKLVATRSDQELGWRNVEAVHDDLPGAVKALASEPGVDKVLVAGSISVVRQLLAAGLLAELHLLMHPIVVRGGMRLFDEGEPSIPLRLLSAAPFETGVLNLLYGTAAPAA